jgi:hypothetical protein
MLRVQRRLQINLLSVAYSEIMGKLGARQLCSLDGKPEPGPYSTDMGMDLIFHSLLYAACVWLTINCR